MAPAQIHFRATRVASQDGYYLEIQLCDGKGVPLIEWCPMVPTGTFWIVELASITVKMTASDDVAFFNR